MSAAPWLFTTKLVSVVFLSAVMRSPDFAHPLMFVVSVGPVMVAGAHAAHTPLLHEPPSHAWPQLPQLLLSVMSDAQELPHHAAPTPQQWPSVHHCEVAVHAVLQSPQWSW